MLESLKQYEIRKADGFRGSRFFTFRGAAERCREANSHRLDLAMIFAKRGKTKATASVLKDKYFIYDRVNNRILDARGRLYVPTEDLT